MVGFEPTIICLQDYRLSQLCQEIALSKLAKLVMEFFIPIQLVKTYYVRHMQEISNPFTNNTGLSHTNSIPYSWSITNSTGLTYTNSIPYSCLQYGIELV